jgi:hypothetical protein
MTTTVNHPTTNAGTPPASTNHPVRTLMQVATWPPLVYLLLGVVCLSLWLVGTSVQVQTSEAWMMHSSVTSVSTLSTFLQVWLLVRGMLPQVDNVPVIFAWGVQFALIVASVGIEMPPHPKWRYRLSWGVVVVLIIVNSCGDYFYSSAYGTWGQIGFTVVILFVTFCLGLFAVMCFVHAFQRMFPSHRP